MKQRASMAPTCSRSSAFIFILSAFILNAQHVWRARQLCKCDMAREDSLCAQHARATTAFFRFGLGYPRSSLGLLKVLPGQEQQTEAQRRARRNKLHDTVLATAAGPCDNFARYSSCRALRSNSAPVGKHSTIGVPHPPAPFLAASCTQSSTCLLFLPVCCSSYLFPDAQMVAFEAKQ
jgi:hypothetical protein